MQRNVKSVLLFLIIAIGCMKASAQDAQAIVKKSYDLMRGTSSYSEATMAIIRPRYTRTLQFKSWSKGTDYSLVYVMSPAKDKGQVSLKRDNEMWNWMPSIRRMIKIPPSMMNQSWMGSDLTNDDIVKESSIVDDYDHKILGEESVGGEDCWEIELVPHEDAAVVWGKIVSMISKKNGYTLQNKYYDEDEELVNTESMSKVKKVGDRTIPTFYEVIPADKPGQKTTMSMDIIRFGEKLNDNFFSIQNAKRVR
ncbi:outer membrane lipoprotein-sorting protein [Halosquirtibacter xylanolyticus]|uniref:outer membrane lipoprotein-sorting protein n=1 Tax=Halosquirtibacter xylanolyticus TaxID=3374599 RepID=UPI0037481726|nr:outer membrane lipoprotein-sorting protein [Prolixibacteraceae bacterium]